MKHPRLNDLEKRNRLIRKLFPDDGGGFKGEPDWEQNVALLDSLDRPALWQAAEAAGVDPGRVFCQPKRFAGMSVEQVVEELRRDGAVTDYRPPSADVHEFFDGNGCPYSIAANRDLERLPLALFRETLLSIAARPDVRAVRLPINDCPVPDVEADFDEWPNTDRALIWTTADVDTVRGWVAALKPDEVFEMPADQLPREAPRPGPGERVIAAWWD